MGTPSFRARIRTSCRVVPSLIVLALLALAAVSCDNNRPSRSVSAQLFTAPITQDASAGSSGIQVLLNKVNILGVIDPDQLANDVQQRQADVHVLNLFQTDWSLLFDGQSGSVVGVDLCDDIQACFAPGAEPVKLHFSSAGLVEAQLAPNSSLSTTVPSIRLKNDWVLSYDANTGNILGFRLVDPVDVVDDQGQPRTLGYRSTTRKTNANFGQGNGLVLSVVITGERLKEITGSDRVSRLFEIEPNKLLVFFSSIPAVHLIDMTETSEIRDWDLDVHSATDYEFIDTSILRGDVKLFGQIGGPQTEPFLPYRDISVQITNNSFVVIDRFHPVTIPTDGSALLYDSATFTFFRVRVVRVGESDEIIGSALQLAVSRDAFLVAMQDASGVTATSGPFTMGATWLHPVDPEILIFEEETDNLLCYDYTKPSPRNPSDPDTRNLTVCVRANRFQSAFDPKGDEGPGAAADLRLIAATSDVRDNRLIFDLGFDRLMAISYPSGNVTVVARRNDIISATGDALAELTLVRPLDENRVRAIDIQSVSLLSVPIDYALFPVSFSE